MTQAEIIEVPATGEQMSYADFLRHTDGYAAEWVNGRVIMMAAVSNDHALISGFLHHVIALVTEVRNAGVVLAEPFVMKTGPDLPGRSPDVFFIARENASRIHQQDLDGPADLVVEVVSPESQKRDRNEKYDEYQKGGVREYWIIDPERKEAEFYVRGADGLYRSAPADASGIFRSTVIDGLWIRVAWLWRKPLPPVLSVLKELRIV